jgi:hypothetical protein
MKSEFALNVSFCSFISGKLTTPDINILFLEIVKLDNSNNELLSIWDEKMILLLISPIESPMQIAINSLSKESN